MKVKELIEILEKCNQEMGVVLYDDMTLTCCEVESVASESDCIMISAGDVR